MSNTVNKFKVGDKIVRVTCGCSDMPINSVWVVSSVQDDVEVELCGKEGVYWFSEYFELAEDEPDVKEDTQEVSDNVNSPKHYASQSIECIVAMEAMLSKEEFIGYLRGNIFKYQWRYKQKNGMEDLKKAQWYQSKLIEKEGCL